MFSRFRKQLGNSRGKLFAAGLVLAVAGAVSAGSATVSATGTDCDDNAVIKCGFSSVSGFISTVNSNNSGNGHSDLKAIYTHYGLVPAQYAQFAASAKQGIAYKNGQIKVDGQIVVQNAKSVGRIASYHGSGYFSTSIPNGPTLYGNITSKTFDSDALPVTVLFGDQGQVLFAVINSCGNPIYGDNIIPQASCDVLNKTAVSGKQNTYDFTAKASSINNATIVSYTYDFGDGSQPQVRTNPNDVVEHTYTGVGPYTASVTVSVTLPGGNHITLTSAPCKKVIEVVQPFAKCDQLAGAILDQDKHSYSFVAKASYGNGMAFTGADFNFGDGQYEKGVKPNLADNTVTANHTYSAAGNYSVTATLYFSANGAVSSFTCSAGVSPTSPPQPECKPGVAEGSPMCNPCKYNNSIPATDAKCVAPVTSLPNTGAGDVIALFGAVAVAGFLVFRQFVYKKHAIAGNAAAMNLEHQLLTAHHHANHAATQAADTAQHTTHYQTTHPHTTHPNATGATAAPTYHKPNRLRPGQHGRK